MKLIATKPTLIFILFCIALASCNTNNEDIAIPKPKGYLRIQLPAKTYTHNTTSCGYSFDVPTYATVENNTQSKTNECWKNVEFKTFNATVHLSYFKLANNLGKYIEDARSLAYRHTVKAEYINETFFKNDTNKTYAVVYDIGGNAASNCQFFITDSTRHFVRGALYYNVAPNSDSLQPVNDFIKQDIQRLIETFEWR
jgi:gliding motility-associated lipoprotein GldD